MRLLMYQDDSGIHVGALRGEQVLNIHALAQGDGGAPHDILALIDGGEDMLHRIERLLEPRDRAFDGVVARPLSSIRILTPLKPRGNVVAIGRNYLEHAQESARASGEEVTRPTVFTKAQTSVIGPHDDIVFDPAVTSQVDWEVELGVVIGRAGKNIPRERALDYVFGYTVINDVSARDIQFGWGGQFFKGKSLDTFCPIGPWIVTRDEIPDPQNLRLTLRVNGETKQDAVTADMIFPVDELIAQLSLGMTLPPGTVIATGTPAGVGFARNPKEFLQDGDVVEAEVREIGMLRNRVVSRGS